MKKTRTARLHDKTIRLARAFSNETVKRLPYVLIVLIIMVFFQSVQNNRTAKSNSIDSKDLLVKVAALSEDNKRLTLQNQKLAKQGVDLATRSVNLNKCVGYAFATYTQTLQPVEFIDIDNCLISSMSAQSGSKPEQSGAQQSLSSPVDSSASSSQSAPSNTTPQPDNSQSAAPTPTEPDKGLVRGIIDFIDPFN
jgi:hypothetical protein